MTKDDNVPVNQPGCDVTPTSLPACNRVIDVIDGIGLLGVGERISMWGKVRHPAWRVHTALTHNTLVPLFAQWDGEMCYFRSGQVRLDKVSTSFHFRLQSTVCASCSHPIYTDLRLHKQFYGVLYADNDNDVLVLFFTLQRMIFSNAPVVTSISRPKHWTKQCNHVTKLTNKRPRLDKIVYENREQLQSRYDCGQTKCGI